MEGLRIIGNPNELAYRYYEQGADEIIFIDTVASLYGRNQLRSVVEAAARNVFVPMTVGGGIRTIEDIYLTLRSGADKVAINTAAINNPEFLAEASKSFGSQCIVLSVEAKLQPEGYWECYTENGRERSYKDVLDWVVEAEQLGAGEVLVTSVDKDGTRKGLDCKLAEAIYQLIQIPVIISGGVGQAAHIIDFLKSPRADAICCGSLFHYGLCSLPKLKRIIADAGYEVRL